MRHKIKASIIGATGYTGLELIRFLAAHPRVEIVHLTSRQHKDEAIGAVFPHLSHMKARITDADHKTAARDSDVVFLALPHKAAQDVVADLHGTVKLIDLSADYRLDDPASYEKYYEAHKHPGLLKEVVYGLPEIVDHEKIAAAQTVANPGCFALLAQLLLHPFKGQIKHADIFAVTGSSGAGKAPTEGTHHPVRNHNIKSYSVNTHRHIPEIVRGAGISEAQLNFVPSSGPFTRGIFAQAFITLASPSSLSFSAGEAAYAPAPFVRAMDTVALANVMGSNFADLSFKMGTDGRILAQGVIDNLVKGAAGTAVQNMNLMFGLPETEGLMALSPLYP
ncbi:MAG: N-acetyl-gamma-glutamyl-phosphate reductase [Alphaproteobacteria bacterium]|nr:N-acetyl-gamma-glutamyl-phosphate reductase [Alphaproteobacteria bacterium]